MIAQRRESMVTVLFLSCTSALAAPETIYVRPDDGHKPHALECEVGAIRTSFEKARSGTEENAAA